MSIQQLYDYLSPPPVPVLLVDDELELVDIELPKEKLSVDDITLAINNAIKSDDIESLKIAVSKCEPEHRVKGEGVFEAVKSKNNDHLRLLIDEGFNIEPDKTSNSIALQMLHGNDEVQHPLAVAVDRCDEFKVRMLLDAGADPNCCGGITSEFAIQTQNLEIVKILTEFGCNFSTPYTDLFTLICSYDKTEILEYLLSSNKNMPSALHPAQHFFYACTLPAFRIILDFYQIDEIINSGTFEISEPPYFDATENSKLTFFIKSAIDESAEAGRVDLLKYLQSIDVELKDKVALLCKAYDYDQTEAFIFIHKSGVDLSVKGNDYIIGAAESGHNGILEYLIKNIDVSEILLKEALGKAFNKKNFTGSRILLTNGAKCDSLNDDAIKGTLAAEEIDLTLWLLTEGLKLPETPHRKYYESLSPLIQSLTKVEEADQPFKYLSKVCDSSGKKLKSDAFPKDAEWHEKPFMQAAIYAAGMASVVWHENPNAARAAFFDFINNDIERVETTAGLSWKKYLSSLRKQLEMISNIEDMIKEVSEVITFPLLAFKYYKGDNISYRNLSILKEKSYELARYLIGKDKATLDFGALNFQWHQGGNRIPAEYRPLSGKGPWARLFNTQHFDNGITIEALDSPQALEEEGDNLHHCVSGYTANCQSGQTHILSVRKNGTSIATIEIGRSYKLSDSFTTPDGKHWEVVQFKGDRNQSVRAEASDAKDELLQRIAAGKVEFYPNMKEIEELNRKNKKYKRDNVTLVSGYDIRELEKVIPLCIKHYAERVRVRRNNGSEVPLFSEKAISVILRKIEDIRLDDSIEFQEEA